MNKIMSIPLDLLAWLCVLCISVPVLIFIGIVWAFGFFVSWSFQRLWQGRRA